MKTELKITPLDLQSINEASVAFRKLSIALRKLDRRTKFEKFYDSVSNFLFGGKSTLPKELKQ